MPKVNIYLPDELADEVKAAKLSLSPVCQRAIREELGRMQAREAATRDIKGVAARLKATIADEEREDMESGHGEGVKWAREYATAAELQYIAEDFEPGRGGPFADDHTICRLVSDQSGEDVVAVSHADDAYWAGFIAGACEVWAAVEPLLGA